MNAPGPRAGASTPSVAAELLHFFGEVEVVFGLWAVVLLAAMVFYAGWEPAKHYFNDDGQLHRAAVRRRDHGARLDAADHRRSPKAHCGVSPMPGGGTPAAWWVRS